MKKIIFAAVISIMFGLGLTSCNSDGAKCYKVTYTAGFGTIGEASYTVYEWINEDQISTQRSRYEAEGYTNIIFTEMSSYTNSATCLALGNASEFL